MREFLRYAANGGRFGGVSVEEPRAGDSSIMTELAAALRAKGFGCRFGIGASEFRVDLAVIDPDDPQSYILGILGDGDSYRSSVNTRDREYARADVLRNLGWQVMHVWSVDWYFRRERVVENVIRTIDAIRAGNSTESEEEPGESNFGISETDDQPVSIHVSFRADYVPTRDAVISNLTDPYSRAAVQAVGKYIISSESPVAEAQLIRTYTRLVGIARMTAEKRRALVDLMRQEFAPVIRGGFVTYWYDRVVPSGFAMYRVPARQEDAREIDCIPLEEILSCIAEAIMSSGSMDKESVPKAVAAMFGFARTGDRIREIVGAALEMAMEDGLVILENGRYRMP
jgi:hypothetical protein